MSDEQNKKSNHFLIDWVTLIIAIVLLGITAYVPPFERQFKLDDITISHPHKGDTFKMGPLVGVSSLVIIIIIAGFNIKKFTRYNFHQALMGALFAITISTLFAHVIKMFVGRYRPDFIDVCDVDFEKVQELYNKYNVSSSISYGPRNLYNTTICRTSKKDLNEERRSFPSGHSSYIFSAMTYLSLFIAGQINLMDKKSYIWKYFVISLPYFVAITVALSRVFDYRHHWEDVTVGSLLGFVFGVLTYFYYFPSLYSEHSDIPYQRHHGYCRKDSQEDNEENNRILNNIEMS
ncbi:acid phosphatase/Vanadium-dependent haloperoxidase [Piromyces finnis]|uniref:Acid phosphatase/Vanadium-dependent haloperoxidase n=1 Tax=Piromyces finnis TaxID=1754191 RepID=A0A1Y1VB54_9FUNG|nr:acid phosphatase/Vanadium-dependent haloperoxidase [Piromyces finnis]|eukprot:ORX51525.1 acid phosphatase/Vanadium-dependent haloperoxidase [Piromyces finnis]